MLERQAGVDRGVDPDRLGREQQRQHLGAVDRHDRDGVAAPHSQLGQRGRGPMHVAGELGEGSDERRVEMLGIGEHGHGHAIRPQVGRPRYELVGARGQAAFAQRDALDRGQVIGALEGRPQQVVPGSQQRP